MRGRARSVRTRIVAWAVAVVAVVLAAGAVLLVWSLDRFVTQQIADQVETELDALSESLDGRDEQAMIALVQDRDDDLLIALHLDGRTVVNDDDALELPSPDAEETAVRAVVDDEPTLVMSEELDDGGIVVVGRTIDEAEGAVATAGWLLAVAVPVAVVLLGTVIWIVTGRALAPVERIRRQAERIDPRALDKRVPVTGTGDEVDRLAGTMNRMLERLEDGYRRQQQFVGDASHELRSPLATIRQFAELARAHPDRADATELADVVLGEGARMQDLVEGLLLLARLDEGDAVARTGVDLDDLALAEASRLRALDRVRVDGSGIAPVQAAGDARLLARALRNLVDNAARHARTAVAITVERQGDRALVHVDDDGAGVPEADRERIFDRFARLDEARARDAGGSGLGLAIVREIVRSHSGTIRVAPCPLGGARFTLDLPAADDGTMPEADGAAVA